MGYIILIIVVLGIVGMIMENWEKIVLFAIIVGAIVGVYHFFSWKGIVVLALVVGACIACYVYWDEIYYWVQKINVVDRVKDFVCKLYSVIESKKSRKTKESFYTEDIEDDVLDTITRRKLYDLLNGFSCPQVVLNMDDYRGHIYSYYDTVWEFESSALDDVEEKFSKLFNDDSECVRNYIKAFDNIIEEINIALFQDECFNTHISMEIKESIEKKQKEFLEQLHSISWFVNIRNVSLTTPGPKKITHLDLTRTNFFGGAKTETKKIYEIMDMDKQKIENEFMTKVNKKQEDINKKYQKMIDDIRMSIERKK